MLLAINLLRPKIKCSLFVYLLLFESFVVVFAFFSPIFFFTHSIYKRRRVSDDGETLREIFSKFTSLVLSTPPANCHTKSISALDLYTRCSMVRSNHFFTSDTMNTDDVSATKNTKSYAVNASVWNTI